MHKAWVALLLLVAFVVPARAQAVDEAGPFAQPVLRRGVERYARILGLDPDQRTQALELHQGYKAAYRALVKDAHAAIEKAAEAARTAEVASDRARFREAKRFIDAADRLEAAFFDDLSALLRPEQAAGMERVRRTRARETAARFAFVAGEGLDLVALADELKLERTSDLAEALDHYEADAERAGKAKHDEFVQLFASIVERGEPGDDPEFMEAALKGILECGLRLRNVNRDHARRVAALLPDDRRDEWTRAVRRASHPRLYAPARLDQLTEWSLTLGDLTPEQRTEIAAIRDAHAAEAEAANAALADAINAAQDAMPGRVMETMMGELPDDHPVREAARARQRVEDSHAQRLLRALTPAQREAAPADDTDPFSQRARIEPDIDPDEAFEELEKEP